MLLFTITFERQRQQSSKKPSSHNHNKHVGRKKNKLQIFKFKKKKIGLSTKTKYFYFAPLLLIWGGGTNMSWHQQDKHWKKTKQRVRSCLGLLGRVERNQQEPPPPEPERSTESRETIFAAAGECGSDRCLQQGFGLCSGRGGVAGGGNGGGGVNNI